jgi:hypothetical protein
MEKDQETPKENEPKAGSFKWIVTKLKTQALAMIYIGIPLAIGVVLCKVIWEWIKFVWSYQI